MSDFSSNFNFLLKIYLYEPTTFLKIKLFTDFIYIYLMIIKYNLSICTLCNMNNLLMPFKMC